MTEDQFMCIDSLSEAVKAIQNCLQCTICLEMISVPVKTRCGHTFCRTCIGTVLSKKNGKCPLCNSNLQRRSISKDEHTEKCINSFERLVQAICQDTNINILSHTRNPRNTREGYPSPNVRRTLDDKTKERKSSSTNEMSGVCPLLCSPGKDECSNDEIVFSKDERIESWLKALPDSEQLVHPSASPFQETTSCLDETATVVSNVSLMSSASNSKDRNEEPQMEHLTDCDSVRARASNSMKGQRHSKASSRGAHNTPKGRNKRRAARSFPERGNGIKVDLTERKQKYEKIHAKVRDRYSAMEQSAKSSDTGNEPLISSIDAANSSKHLTGPGNTTKETWNRVVQFGKEMRTKRSKLKSLNVSVQSTSGSRLSDEHGSNKRTKRRKMSPTNLQTRSRSVDDTPGDDLIENRDESNCAKNDESKIVKQHKSAGLESKDEAGDKITPDTSFISLEQEGRVPIMSLCREQMDDIIGVTSKLDEGTTSRRESKENLSEDHGTIPKKRLSLRKRSESSRNSLTDFSPTRVTPVKVNLEERYELLRASPPLRSPRNELSTPVKVYGTKYQTESASKLSLKKSSPTSKKVRQDSKEATTSYEVSQSANVKCNLMKQINGCEIDQRRGVIGNAEISSRDDKNEKSGRVDLAKASSYVEAKTCLVPFNKLGKVFKKRRKVKFYKLGRLRWESVSGTLSSSISNASRINVITFLTSPEEPLETSKTSEEAFAEENLENRILSRSLDRIGTDHAKTAKDALNESKQKYKRIITDPTSGSNTDTGTFIDKRTPIVVERRRINDKNVSVVKRKRTPSVESDEDTVVDEIVNNWCNDLNASRRSSKKGKLEMSETARASSDVMIGQPPESIEFDSWNRFATPLKQIPTNESQDRVNNDVIDEARLNRTDEIISKKGQNTIDGHIDEAVAEVMTDSLGTHFFTNENILVDLKERQEKESSLDKQQRNKEKNRTNLTSCSYVETNDLFAETNGKSWSEENLEDFERTLIDNLNDSNAKNGNCREKENARKRERDTTIVAVGLTKGRKIDEPLECTNTSMLNDVRKYAKSKDNNIKEPEEISDEYDSLLDVTQDQLLLKALEEDLFGAANSRSLGEASNTTKKTSSQGRKLRGETPTRTPTRTLKVEKMNPGNKNTESSSEEDEIIENTPQSQKKFTEVDHSAESRARKSLNVSQATPVSRKNFKAPTTTAPATIVGKLGTPIDQNKIRPLYQSTPKIINVMVLPSTASNREKGQSKFLEEKKKVLESIAETREKGSMTQVKETTTAENANRTRDKRELCFVWSSLEVSQIESIKRLALLIGASTTQSFTPAVTHVIVATNQENNAATKTLKFLQGIAYRKFVVSFKWVVDSLKKGKLLDEEPYEAVDCYTLEAGPRKSRLRHGNLFDGFAFLCIEPFPNITVVQCQDLLKAIGATIVQNIGELTAIKDKHKVILLQNEAHKEEVVECWYKKSNAIPVSCDWIVECISQYKLVSCYMYLHEIVPEDVVKSGYPEEMIDPDEFDSTCDTSTGH